MRIVIEVILNLLMSGIILLFVIGFAQFILEFHDSSGVSLENHEDPQVDVGIEYPIDEENLED
jgi:hypothetical protein